MRKNLITVENLENNIKKNVELLNELIRYQKFECTNFNEEVLREYIQQQSVVKVADYFNQNGYRIATDNSNRKYISNDISQIIMAKDIDADPGLHAFAKKIHLHMKKKVGSLYN
jgi:hypothetical protein